MNERYDPHNNKITPLFQSPCSLEPIREEDMLRFLDEPDDSETKRAFLNQCALADEALEHWQSIHCVMDAGKALPSQKPDPAIRSRILDAAYAATQGAETLHPRSTRHSGLPGWRWAWAALFLAMLWSGYQEFQPSTTLSSSNLTSAKDTLDYELLTLEAELELLQSELGMDLTLGLDGNA